MAEPEARPDESPRDADSRGPEAGESVVDSEGGDGQNVDAERGDDAAAAHPSSSPFMSNASPTIASETGETATVAASTSGDETGSAAVGASTPRRRLTPWKAAVPLVTLVAGLMFAVSSHTAQGGDLRSDTTDLADVVRRADHRVKTKQVDVAALRSQVEAEQKAAAAKGGGAARVLELTKAADKAQDPAGLAPLKGSAVSVTLDDSKKKVADLPANGTPDWLVVHQQDVQAVVNALWAGGARGMMLMDQRIVSTSAVRCVGNTLILQGRVYSPPFTITAVGDPVKLKAALDDDASVKIYKQYVDLVGLGYDLKDVPDATLPAFTGPVGMKFAKASH